MKESYLRYNRKSNTVRSKLHDFGRNQVLLMGYNVKHAGKRSWLVFKIRGL
jgi:hypothetical protein